ncbi:MAG: hypothetical protein KIT84_02450 [Labilithrix sp.]|nr:hypothetical protein [Labilithrix sp.]MCW5809846.1 hypothetical protein [Labilithrix sp.]
MRSRGVTASDGARSYVVGLLSDLAKPGSPVERTLEQPLTLLLNEALHTAELGERFERLRVLGDGVLYSSGFFADHFEARGVDTKYIIGIGRTAYESAGSLIMSRAPEPQDGPVSGCSSRSIDIFKELAEHFARFVEVIGEVANATIARGVATSKGLVKLYERWLKTRSDSLAEALTSHGMLVTAGGTRGGILS